MNEAFGASEMLAFTRQRVTRTSEISSSLYPVVGRMSGCGTKPTFRSCDEIFLYEQFPVFALLLSINSLIGIEKFPVPLRRKFGCNLLKSRAERAPNLKWNAVARNPRHDLCTASVRCEARRAWLSRGASPSTTDTTPSILCSVLSRKVFLRMVCDIHTQQVTTAGALGEIVACRSAHIRNKLT
jgi:hypothetical protein